MKPPFLLISYQGFDQTLMHSSSSLPSWPRGRQFPHSGGRRLGRLGPWHSEKLLVILDLPLRLTGLWMFVPLSKTRVITSITPWITMVHHTAVYCGCTGCNLESMGSTWVSVLEPGCQVADVTYPKKHRVLFRALRGIPCASKFFHSLFNSVLSLCYGTWHVEQWQTRMTVCKLCAKTCEVCVCLYVCNVMQCNVMKCMYVLKYLCRALCKDVWSVCVYVCMYYVCMYLFIYLCIDVGQ